DLAAFTEAGRLFTGVAKQSEGGISAIPDELIGTDYEWGITPPLFGLPKRSQQFNPRQAVALAGFSKYLRKALSGKDDEYSTAVRAMLTMTHGRLADKCAIHCVWNAVGEKLENVFGRPAISMSWNYAELNPFSGRMGDWTANLEWVLRNVETAAFID